MNKCTKKIAITTGDVNGIGAEVTIKALNRLDLPLENLVLISNPDVLEASGIELKNDYRLEKIDFDKNNIALGQNTAASGEFSFQALMRACDLAKNGEIDAIVTAPVSKEALHLAGHNFNGQTEVLQKYLARAEQHAEMLFVAKDFRVLLLTRHLPLKEISITKKMIINKISVLDKFFKCKLNINTPKFALCGLNPHAGENGILGQEEVEIIMPAVEILRSNCVDITNPLPADTLFIKAGKNYLAGEPAPYDCYIAMYHDQGLIPIKTIASDKTVNMTIGLDVIRTSPSHGTAFNIAGKNVASENSMIEAILQALNI